MAIKVCITRDTESHELQMNKGDNRIFRESKTISLPPPDGDFRNDWLKTWKRLILRKRCWNVRSPSRTGAVKSPLLDSYRLKVLAVQKTKWIDREITDLRSGMIFNKGKLSRTRSFGVDFKGKNAHLHSYTNVHSSTEEKDDNIKGDRLGRFLDSLPT